MTSFNRLLADYEGVRRHLLDAVADAPAEKALRIPPGEKSNAHWNLGHLLHVQCSFFYTRCGLEYPLPRGFREAFARGTSPAAHDSLTADWDEVRRLARLHSTGLAAAHGHKENLPLARPFELMNVRVLTVGEAMSLLLVHEGEHRARILRLLA